jgi:hypothetical protein
MKNVDKLLTFWCHACGEKNSGATAEDRCCNPMCNKKGELKRTRPKKLKIISRATGLAVEPFHGRHEYPVTGGGKVPSHHNHF